MPLLIDTRTVPASRSAEFWVNASREIYHPLHVQVEDGGDALDGRMWGEWLASIGLFRVQASPNTMIRTWEDVAQGDPECLHVQVLVHGRLSGEQQGRASVIGPGDIIAYDTSFPAAFRSPEPFDLLVLKLPKTMLGRRGARISRSTAVRISGHAGLPRVAAQFFLGVAGAVADGSIPLDDADVAERVVDLACRLYFDLDATRSTGPRSRAEIRDRALSFIQEHLGDPDLRPDQVARACFISTRYLHRLFADAGLTVSASIRDERLSRCRRDLLDSEQAAESVATIAARWGFTNLSHFSRLFRSAYGVSPREFRRAGRDETPRS